MVERRGRSKRARTRNANLGLGTMISSCAILEPIHRSFLLSHAGLEIRASALITSENIWKRGNEAIWRHLKGNVLSGK
jgi:hypothetical protein